MLKRIKDIRNLGCEWKDLRHDRERDIAIYWFDQGTYFGQKLHQEDSDYRRLLKGMGLDTEIFEIDDFSAIRKSS